MAVTHTQGPWRATKETETEWLIQPADFWDGPMIARLQCIDGNFERLEIDAYLIAAAPDLLHALRVVCEELERRNTESGMRNARGQDTVDSPSLYLAKCAIATATRAGG